MKVTLDDVRAQLRGKPPHRADFSHAIPLVDLIEARWAEDPEYAADVEAWLDVNIPASTVHLRDKICEPFREHPTIVEIGKRFNPTTEWDNTWMPLDTAIHCVRNGMKIGE